MAVILNLVIDALLGCRRQANLCFHFAANGDPGDYMKPFLQILLIEIAEVNLKTTFPTSCRGLLVLCTGLLLSLWLGVTTERTIRFHRPVVRRPMMLLRVSFVLYLTWLKKAKKTTKTPNHWILYCPQVKRAAFPFSMLYWLMG